MFVFGTQYLRGETPERDQWKRDLANIKKCGFNTVRAWLNWNTLEKSEGVIDYDYLNTFLDYVKENGLQTGLLFHLHAAPEWLCRKHPEYYYVGEDQNAFIPATRANTPNGGWPGLCFDHNQVRQMEKRFIEQIVSVTKGHDEVAFYEPMNEPHSWVDPKKNPAGIFCYCDASKAKFQAWLEKKYGTLARLNEAWGRHYNHFSEVVLPHWVAAGIDYIDFRQFMTDNIVEEITFRTEVIRSIDPETPVIAHSWGQGAVRCPNLGGMAFDDWQNAEVFPMWGYSAFPKSIDDSVIMGLGCVATRNAAQGKRFWQSELSAGINGCGLNLYGKVDDNTFDNWTFESIRNGAKGVLYWQYRMERYGSEIGGFALTDYNGEPTNLLNRASKICKMLQENEDAFQNFELSDAEVAIIFSKRSYFADWTYNNRNNMLSIDCLSGYYRMLWEENVACDIIHEEYITAEQIQTYKLVILPMPFAISGQFLCTLKTYIFNGGTVLSDPYLASFDTDYKLSRSIPGYGFDIIAGVQEKDIRIKPTLTLKNNQKTRRISGNYFQEEYKNITGTGLYFYEDGVPAIVSNSFGKGTMIQSGINLGHCYAPGSIIVEDDKAYAANNTVHAKQIVMEIAEKCGVSKNPCTHPAIRGNVLYHAGSDDLLILINNEDKQVDAEFRLEQTYQSISVIYGSASVALHPGRVAFQLGNYETAVIRLCK